ncbi:MAG: hypothetical protein LCH53_04535 [Bacteroidetes bacterium]|nr:hypothetical protein [Bacteroidota bacterium]
MPLPHLDGDRDMAAWLLLYVGTTPDTRARLSHLLDGFPSGRYLASCPRLDTAPETYDLGTHAGMRDAVVSLSLRLDRPAVFVAWTRDAMTFRLGEQLVTFSREADGT